MRRTIKNILLVRNDRFGEFLLNIPAIRAVKEAYPEAKITLAVSAGVKELAETVEYSDRVIVWDDVFRRSLRRQRFDACVVLNPTKQSHIASFLAGIPVRVGYDRKFGFLLTRKIPDNKGLGLRHEIESNLELVSLIGARTSDTSTLLRRLPEPHNPVYAQAVAVHPFTSDPVKQWPIERFMELAGRITQELKAKVVLVGKIEDRGQSPLISPPGIINLIDKTGLVELAQVLKQCRLLITCDSGPMHLAEAVGTPVAALFRNDLIGKTARRWGPRLKGSIVIERNNLADISTDEVFGKVKEALNI